MSKALRAAFHQLAHRFRPRLAAPLTVVQDGAGPVGATTVIEPQDVTAGAVDLQPPRRPSGLAGLAYQGCADRGKAAGSPARRRTMRTVRLNLTRSGSMAASVAARQISADRA
jgi:hypothetical protein